MHSPFLFGSGQQQNVKVVGLKFWSTMSLRHQPWGKVYYGRTLSGHNVVEHDVSGANPLGQNFLVPNYFQLMSFNSK